jgi:hypothetical protein
MRSTAVVVLLALTTIAEADVSKAWQAVRANAGTKATAVLAVDVGAIAKLPSFPKLAEAVLAAEPRVELAVAWVKRACKLDLLALVDGLVIVGDPLGKDGGALYLQLTIDRTKAMACAGAIAKEADKTYAVAVTDDAITLRGKQGHLAWVDTQVVAIALEVTDKAMLDRRVKQPGFDTSAVGALATKLDPKSLAWIAFSILTPERPLASWFPVTSGSGTFTLTDTTISTSHTILAATTKQATSLVSDLNKDLIKDAAKASAAGKKALSALKITSQGPTITVTAKLPEADLAAALLERAKRPEPLPPAKK